MDTKKTSKGDKSVKHTYNPWTVGIDEIPLTSEDNVTPKNKVDDILQDYKNEFSEATYKKIRESAINALKTSLVTWDSVEAHPDINSVSETTTSALISTETAGRYVPAEDLMFLKPKDVEHGIMINIDTFVNDLIEIKFNKGNLSEDECNGLYDELYDLVMKHKIEGNDTP